MSITHEFLNEQLSLANRLLAGRDRMLEPQDLPGRYGRVVAALDHLLLAMKCESVVAGGWAVWRHGFIGRVTQVIDVVLPEHRIKEFLAVAAVGGFRLLPGGQGTWPKLVHEETAIDVDVLPEGGRPGSSARPAPTTIPHPSTMGATQGRLTYIKLPSLIELKLAAGRLRDEADIVELIRQNDPQLTAVRAHLASVHPQYAARFDMLLERAHEPDANS